MKPGRRGFLQFLGLAPAAAVAVTALPRAEAKEPEGSEEIDGEEEESAGEYEPGPYYAGMCSAMPSVSPSARWTMDLTGRKKRGRRD